MRTSSFLKVFTVSCTLVIGQAAFAADDAYDKLVQEVVNKTEFEQITHEKRCPKSIIPEISKDAQFLKPGDEAIYLSSKEAGESFTHEGNRLYYRPGLKEGKTHVLDRNNEFVAGVAYTVRKQSVKGGIISSSYSAKIGSLAMIASTNYVLKYDSVSDTISYSFSGNGVEDVECTFLKVE